MSRLPSARKLAAAGKVRRKARTKIYFLKFLFFLLFNVESGGVAMSPSSLPPRAKPRRRRRRGRGSWSARTPLRSTPTTTRASLLRRRRHKQSEEGRAEQTCNTFRLILVPKTMLKKMRTICYKRTRSRKTAKRNEGKAEKRLPTLHYNSRELILLLH